MVEIAPNREQREQEPPKRKIYVFVGLEGSGKSTQAKLLATALHLPYISTGDMVRERAANDEGELGNKCREIVDHNGGYLPAPDILSLQLGRLSREDTEDGAVLDGALRSMEEAEGFSQMLENAGRGNSEIVIISLRSPGWESAERLFKRGRKGDDLDGVLKRFGEYYKDLGKRNLFAKSRWKFIQVSSRGINGGPKSKQEEIDKVQGRIWEAITR